MADRIAEFFKQPRPKLRADRGVQPQECDLMSKWTEQLPEAARDYIGGRRVDEVECIIGDIAGVARGKAMPASKFAKQTSYFLPNSIFLQTITGEWADNPFERLHRTRHDPCARFHHRHRRALDGGRDACR